MIISSSILRFSCVHNVKRLCGGYFSPSMSATNKIIYNMEEVKRKIERAAEADIAAANIVNDIGRRETLENYLLELQREKILLLQEAQRSAPSPG